MSAESPHHVRSGGPLVVPPQQPSDKSLIDAVSGFINDVTLSSSTSLDPKDVIQWARFETADINEPISEDVCDNYVPPQLLVLGYGSGVQVWLVPHAGDAQEVLAWRQGSVRVLRLLPTPQRGDCFASKRPLIALCDSSSPGPAFCTLSFISIKGGEQVKSIKFKNQILDVLANKRSIVVTFSERFAVFDAGSLEDRVSVTTCYPCPCPLGGAAPVNPIALGERWVAYADKKLHPAKKSNGGCEVESTPSYTATVLHAAKSLSKGLRGLGETVAQSLAGGRGASQSPSPPNTDLMQPGVVSVLDIAGTNDELPEGEEPGERTVAHFAAHSDAVMALQFDPSGMLLVTADKRGYDFHVFRLQPHPLGPNFAAVHHLYILHRGDTTAKVQDIAISLDSRWVAVSTLRGTTHVFAVCPYGGAATMRTHSHPHVVDKLSRFQRSAGLPIQPAPPAPGAGGSPARSGSPVNDSIGQGTWIPNPRLPPYPVPVTCSPQAQLRHTANLPTHTITRTSSGRQRLSSYSEEGAPLLARAAWPPGPPALYLASGAGLLQYMTLRVRLNRSVPKEKACDESPIEVEVEEVSQWPLQRPPCSADLLAPLPPSNPLLQPQSWRRNSASDNKERWLAQVEMLTHAGPHRRLWMGPQFVFKTYSSSGAEMVEIEPAAAAGGRGASRSNPVSVPAGRPHVPVLVDGGSFGSGSVERADSFRARALLADGSRAASLSELRLREDLAEAMREDGSSDECSREEAAGTWAGAWVGAGAGVQRAVSRQGAVRSGLPASPPARRQPAAAAADAPALPNTDEATFRALRPLPAEPPPRAPLLLRALPSDTTLPVQTVHPLELADTHMHLHLHRVRDQDQDRDRDADDTSTDVPHVLDSQNIHETMDANTDLNRRERDVCEGSRTREGDSSECVERKRDDAISLPQSSRPADDIQPPAPVRRKKSPTPKSVSDRVLSDVSVKYNNYSIEADVPRERDDGEAEAAKIVEVAESKKIKGAKREKQKIRDCDKVKATKELKETKEAIGTDNAIAVEVAASVTVAEANENIETPIVADESDRKEAVGSKTDPKRYKKLEQMELKRDIVELKKEPSVEVELPSLAFSKSKSNENVIETEDQAWHMLTEESVDVGPRTISDKVVDAQPKPKKNRKKEKEKTHDDSLDKTDDDSFIEIHQIEVKQQPSSSELVSISTPFENVETSNMYASKSWKLRSSKSATPEKKEIEKKYPKTEPSYGREQADSTFDTSAKADLAVSDEHTFPQLGARVKSKGYKDRSVSEQLKMTESANLSMSDFDLPTAKLQAKSKKSKSLSPYLEKRKLEKNIEKDPKDVYVINTNEEETPNVLITSSKTRKKSPQPSEKSKEDNTDKPPVSWSSIAASKGVKKNEEPLAKDVSKQDIVEEVKTKCELKNVPDEDSVCPRKISLQDMLVELCHRRDIIVAECDAPSELNFVEEHHAMLDLPPLEGFGMDDFNIEAMRDSLIETAPPQTSAANVNAGALSMDEVADKPQSVCSFDLMGFFDKCMPEERNEVPNTAEHKKTEEQMATDEEAKSYDADVRKREKEAKKMIALKTQHNNSPHSKYNKRKKK